MAGFTEDEKRKRFEQGSLDYKGHQILAKRDYSDFVAYDQGFYIREGFVIVKDGCNAMPGAGWVKTVDRAKECIDILEAVGEERFHEVYGKVRQAKREAIAAVLASYADPAAAEENEVSAPGPR